MLMGGNQVYFRRQQTGVGWLVDKWLAYCQAKNVDGRTDHPKRSKGRR